MHLHLVLAASFAFSMAAAAAAACPADAPLAGAWQARIEGFADAVVTLEPHPDYAGSVRGHTERGGRRILVAGDVVDGEFTLEESENGTNISAAWLGDVVDGSCGREIRGVWKAEGAPAGHPFILRRR